MNTAKRSWIWIAPSQNSLQLRLPLLWWTHQVFHSIRQPNLHTNYLILPNTGWLKRNTMPFRGKLGFYYDFPNQVSFSFFFNQNHQWVPFYDSLFLLTVLREGEFQNLGSIFSNQNRTIYSILSHNDGNYHLHYNLKRKKRHFFW